MPIIQQEILFDMKFLFDLELTHQLNTILSGIDIHPILAVLMKRKSLDSDQNNRLITLQRSIH